MQHYVSPQEVRHWIPKAKLHIKNALEELEHPNYKADPGERKIFMHGVDDITPISYSYGSLGLAIELIYKTLAIANFKPIFTGRGGHRIADIYENLNLMTKVNITYCESSQGLMYYYNTLHIPETEKDLESVELNSIISMDNFRSIISEIDKLMVNASVKYNNIPQHGGYADPRISNLPFFEAFGYTITQLIIKFMIEISELAYNLLGLSHHIMFNVQKIFPEFSFSKVEQAKVICVVHTLI